MSDKTQEMLWCCSGLNVKSFTSVIKCNIVNSDQEHYKCVQTKYVCLTITVDATLK